MRKLRCHNNLLFAHRTAFPAKGGFSLAELVVSVGILILMLSLAGQVFNFTVQSTGQATALTEVMQELRALEKTLRDDLRGVQPGHSLILIQGNPVNAYWTQAGKDADDDGDPSDAKGYPHVGDPEREDQAGTGKMIAPRADILMFFTARPSASFVETAGQPVMSGLQQCVYGHAELGEYAPSAAGAGAPLYNFEVAPTAYPTQTLGGAEYPSVTTVSSLPAAQWHLARRSVLLLPTDPPSVLTPPLEYLDDLRLLEGGTDVIGNFSYEQQVLRARLDATGNPTGGPWFLPGVFGDTSQPYENWRKPFVRGKLDPTPPALFANRIGQYLLPNCASFKVEWSLNPRSEFVKGRLDNINEVLWFDPGDVGTPADPYPDPLRSLKNAAKSATGLTKNTLECLLGTKVNNSPIVECRPFHPDGMAYSLSDRFRGSNFPNADPDLAWDQLAPDKKRPNLVVFTATRPVDGAPESEPVLDPMFPGALRITVDVYDKERRLERPIRHVMIVPIGG